MKNYEQILKQIQSNDIYQTNLEWGKPRAGHPEGSIRQHIQELDSNLDRLKPKLSDDEYWKLRVLVHTHDTFKRQDPLRPRSRKRRTVSPELSLGRTNRNARGGAIHWGRFLIANLSLRTF